tara:strand:- start:2415 stop:2978 length:564 start_codon:yes stop_codon:yes gene_type:complete
MPQLKITDKKGLVQSTGAGVESDSLVVLKNSAGLRDSRSFRSATSGVARTGATATELSVNTHYVNGTATGLAMTIPSAASSNIGDWITVFYTTAVNNSANHTYTTTTDTAYALGSTITRIGGAVTSATDVSVAADNIITIAGTTNGDAGQGTTLKFVNTTGTTNGWAAEVIILNQGAGSAALASAFS